MQKTIHEGILSYMKLSENESQSGYPILLEGAKLSWYKLFKKTKESIVRKWVEVNDGILEYPCSLEDLLGLYVIDKCGDLAALFEDTAKSILTTPKSKCGCNSCDMDECMCPSVQDSIVQTSITIEGTPYVNKKATRLLKNGNIVEETLTWYPQYKKDGSFDKAKDILSQRTICQIDILPCGCPVSSEENAKLLFGCGCICDWHIPAMRNRYPALYNEFGYYKKDEAKREVHIFDTKGKKSRINMVEVVYQSNGEDMLIPEYAYMAFLSLLDWTKKMFSPSFNYNDRIEARKLYNRQELDMMKHLNPLPYELVVQAGEYPKKYRPRYDGIHSDFLQQPLAQVCNIQPPPAQNVTNIFGGSGSGTSGGVLTGIVNAGGIDDPVSGATTYQSSKLIGVGKNNRLKIEIDDQPMSSYGINKSFNYNNTTGLITFLEFRFPVPEIGQDGSSIWIPLNQ